MFNHNPIHVPLFQFVLLESAKTSRGFATKQDVQINAANYWTLSRGKTAPSTPAPILQFRLYTPNILSSNWRSEQDALEGIMKIDEHG
jgi:hypothetical protein